MSDYSKPLRILMVEDDSRYAEPLQAHLKRTSSSELAGGEFGEVEVQRVETQDDATAVIVAGHQFDIILLDLNYPAERGHAAANSSNGNYQGMQWLPTLRQEQPFATIIISTNYTEPENVLKALRDCGADDFIGKTGQEARFSNFKLRIKNAWENARLRRQVQQMEKDFSFLIRTLAARTVAEDIGTLLRQTNNSLNSVARQLESGDASLLPQAANTIKAQFNHLLKEFDGLMKLLAEGDDRQPTAFDVGDLASRMLDLYKFRIKEARVKTPRVECPEKVFAETYESNLKLALHEVILNALDALKDLAPELLPQPVKELTVTVEKHDQQVSIKVMDNGPGFSDEALQQLYKRHRSAKGAPHLGLGLYIAKRMMSHLGGDINAVNRSDGPGAEVTLTFKDLSGYEDRNGDK